MNKTTLEDVMDKAAMFDDLVHTVVQDTDNGKIYEIQRARYEPNEDNTGSTLFLLVEEA